MVTINDFGNCLRQNYPELIKPEQEKALKFIFTNRILKDKIILDEIIKVMRSFGIKEDMPKSKKHLNYDSLDLKSKRILNRLFNYIQTHALDLYSYFNDLLVIQTVKTKTKVEKVELMKAETFFNKLHEINVKVSGSVHENLCKFLCIDDSYPHSLMLKKLKRAEIDFLKSSYLRMLGFKKRKFIEVKGSLER